MWLTIVIVILACVMGAVAGLLIERKRRQIEADRHRLQDIEQQERLALGAREKDALQRQVEEAHEKIARGNGDVAASREQTLLLQQELDQLRTQMLERKETAGQVEALQRQLGEAQQAARTTKAQDADELAEAKRKLVDATKQASDQSGTVTELRTQFEQAKHAAESATNQARKFETQLKTAQKEAQGKADEAARLAQSVADLQERLTKSEERVRKNESELQQVRQELLRIREDSTQLAEARAQISRLQGEGVLLAPPDKPALSRAEKWKPEPPKEKPAEKGPERAEIVLKENDVGILDILETDPTITAGQRETIRMVYMQFARTAKKNPSAKVDPSWTVLDVLDRDPFLKRGQREGIRAVCSRFGRKKS